jgi:hypothetical protein
MIGALDSIFCVVNQWNFNFIFIACCDEKKTYSEFPFRLCNFLLKIAFNKKNYLLKVKILILQRFSMVAVIVVIINILNALFSTVAIFSF